MRIERLGKDRILIQFYKNGEEQVISDNNAKELVSNLNLALMSGPPNNTVEDRQAFKCKMFGMCKFEGDIQCGPGCAKYTPAT